MADIETVWNERWGKGPNTPTVAFFHERLRRRARELHASSGKSLEETVFDPAYELPVSAFAEIEREFLDTGQRFEFSAQISIREEPEKYRAAEAAAATTEFTPDGEAVMGSGDNVFAVPEDMEGTALYVDSVEVVVELLQNGVPEGTIAIIDDSGGTLTAPVLEGFAGVVCLGGTVRSHLGILTREYGVPCLMAAGVTGVENGQRLKVEYSKSPPSGEEYTAGAEGSRARIWAA